MIQVEIKDVITEKCLSPLKSKNNVLDNKYGKTQW